VEFFKVIRSEDANTLNSMKKLKDKVLSDASTLKKNKSGIQSYSSISKK